MIPVSTFKDRTIAVFGLGGSGIATAQALVAGGAHVVADDDSAAGRAKAEAAGLPVASLKEAGLTGAAGDAEKPDDEAAKAT